MPAPWISLPVGAVVLLLLLVYALRRHQRAVAEAAHVRELDRVARARAHDFALLLRLSSSFGAALDLDTLKATIATELPALIGTDDFWIVARLGGWTLLAGESDEPGGVLPHDVTTRPDAWECFPLVAAGEPVGMMGIRQPPHGFTGDQRRTFTTISTLTASAVRNIQLFNRVRDLSMIDPLTRCLTRQFGVEGLSREMRRMRRAHSELCVALLDVDRFKELNDTYGHAAGDRALAMIGRVLKEGLRVSDIACRYGGDEFLIVLPETSLPGAMHAVEHLRRKITTTPIDAAEGLGVSVSVGITFVDSDEEDPAVPIARADAALYEAKRSGRNRVAVKDVPPSDGSRAPSPVEISAARIR